MQVSLTAMGGLERRLEVAVPAADVTSEIESRLKQLARTSRLKGFRPGKAPLPVVRKQFGDQVRAEVVSDIMRKSFAEAVSKEQLTPAAGPRIEPIALDPGSDLKYAAVFEVMPEVKVAPFAAIQIQRPSAAVTEADVDAMIESMRRQRPEFKEVSRVAQSTDRVTVDYDGTVGAEAFEAGQGRDVPFVIGAGQVLPQFDQAALGAAAGETREVTISYPENHGSKALAGKTAQFKLTVKKIEEQRLPPVDDEFCRAYGVEEGGIDMLRTEVRASMEREMNSVIRGRVRNQVMEALYRNNPLEVPKALVDDTAQQMQMDAGRRAGAREASQLPPRAQFLDAARQRVALGMVMGEIVRSLSLTLDRARLQTRVDDLVASFPNPEETRRSYLSNPEAMRQIESAVLEDQAIDAIVEKANLTEQPASFRELTGFGQNADISGSSAT
ncbi:MAG TPA: trigger factor [Steroidobacteraceae bacterium]|jgi:trigger factor|nr:trigger factor [Steroidobacteraceae bacterium]